MRIQFEIPGPPKGKGRPRFASRKGKPVTFTPDKTVAYEGWVKLMFSKAAPDHKPFDGPVKIEITAYFPIPKSRPQWWQKAVREREEPVTTRPDADNILKVVCDALNGIAWMDDRQVVRACITKIYGERPRVDVIVEDVARATRKEATHGKSQ